MTDTTVLGSVVLLARAEPTDHTISVLVGVVRCFVVTFVAGEDFGAAAETEPTVGFAVMGAAASARELLAADDAELFFRLMEKETRLLVWKTIQNRVLGLYLPSRVVEPRLLWLMH